jgi:HEAT repeat protein
MDYLSQALRDPDLSVRISAVESVPLEGEGLTLLREALADTDELVHSSARDRLQEAESQGAD